MVHEGAKLNNFNAVCLIIVAHEGAKFNEPGDGLTNQLCRCHSAFVREENLRGHKTLPPFNCFNAVRPLDARFWGNEKTHAAQIRATFVT